MYPTQIGTRPCRGCNALFAVVGGQARHGNLVAKRTRRGRADRGGTDPFDPVGTSLVAGRREPSICPTRFSRGVRRRRRIGVLMLPPGEAARRSSLGNLPCLRGCSVAWAMYVAVLDLPCLVFVHDAVGLLTTAEQGLMHQKNRLGAEEGHLPSLRSAPRTAGTDISSPFIVRRQRQEHAMARTRNWNSLDHEPCNSALEHLVPRRIDCNQQR
ncbi:uncharacterized protein PSFLO_02119 [Pseudozyma flocculosa]|uniref:Uncharacterized protein n=1 Tax=Pseudozyma flocculosa TaxID=84751 RepID=A0A5C3EWP8_9BASI|nr:uncharacterized protein PSFLO_02119 [Pseudozyma flocculosa]